MPCFSLAPAKSAAGITTASKVCLPSAHAVHLRRQFHASAVRTADVHSHKLPRLQPDIKSIIENPEKAALNVKRRNSPIPSEYASAEAFVQGIVNLQSEVRNLGEQVRQLQSERNALSAIFSQKAASEEDKKLARKKAEAIRSLVQGSGGLEDQFEKQEARLLSLAVQLPNETSEGTPDGGYEACTTVKTTSNAAVAADLQTNPAADHVDLLTQLGWLYLPTHITGTSWPYLVGGGARLELALTQYAVSCALKQGFEIVLPPDVVKSEIMRRCGFNPRDAGGEAQTYFVSTGTDSNQSSPEPELALAATAEVPLAGYYMNRRFKSSTIDLPQKTLAFGHAFRAEAGARGRESRGLYRVHQFSKVELFVVTEATDQASQEMLRSMTDLQWSILSSLNLPLRLLRMSTQELGSSAYEKYDIEAWMPGRGAWGELASASNCTSYQARRLDIRHTVSGSEGSIQDKKTAKTTFCHTLNATAAAIPRLIVALIENGAIFDENGRLKVLQLPEVLRAHWLGREANSTTHVLDLAHSVGKSRQVVLEWLQS